MNLEENLNHTHFPFSFGHEPATALKPERL